MEEKTNLEEGKEDVRARGREKDEGQESGEPPVEDGRPHPDHRCLHPGVPSPRGSEEEVDDVGGEIDAEPDGDDEGHAGEHVHGQTPEVHEARNLGDCGDNAEDDEESAPDARQEEKNCDEDGSDGASEVLEQLLLDHLVRQPVGIEGGDIVDGRGAVVGGDVGLVHHLLEPLHARHPLLGRSEASKLEIHRRDAHLRSRLAARKVALKLEQASVFCTEGGKEEVRQVFLESIVAL